MCWGREAGVWDRGWGFHPDSSILSWVGFWINREATSDRITLGKGVGRGGSRVGEGAGVGADSGVGSGSNMRRPPTRTLLVRRAGEGSGRFGVGAGAWGQGSEV